MKLALLLLSLVSASALMVGVSPVQASRVAAGPMMACNGGKGGKGGKTPPKDKWLFRPKVNKLVQEVREPHHSAALPNLPREHTSCSLRPAARIAALSDR